MEERRFNVSTPGIAAFVACLGLGAVANGLLQQKTAALAFILAGTYLLIALKVVRQWEKVAVLRFGRYRGLRGPGLFAIIPVVDSLSRYVDQRVRVATLTAGSTLTRDTVPVNVDANVYGWCGMPRNPSSKSRISCRPSP